MTETALENRPLGVFDSGIGGLTFVKELRRVLPFENIVYFGDTARLPYGSKSKKIITRFSLQNAIFLNSKGVKIIAIACNSASAASVEFLRNFLRLPVTGVIESGALASTRTTKCKRIGVIGTKSTINSMAYTKAIREIDPAVQVFEVATPLLVHIVEERWVEKDVTRMILEEYLKPMLDNDIDTLILGCTHYPLLKEQIQMVVGDKILVDPNVEMAIKVQYMLREKRILNIQKEPGTTKVYVSDLHPEVSIWVEELLGDGVEVALAEVEQTELI